MHLFVYFKFNSSLSVEIQLATQKLQTLLKNEFPSIEVTILKRPEHDDNGLTTWMETYQIQDADQALFQTRLQTLATELDLPLPRHTEVFVPVSL